MDKKKVLFIDSWTQGIRSFLPISNYLRTKNIDSLLVHYGSWDAEPGRPEEERIQGLLCRDISYYKTNLLYNIFKKERPDCIITLTTNNLIDRAKILAAHALRIPIVFLMHGILAVNKLAVKSQVQVLESELKKKRFSKIPKHLRYIIPNYFYSGLAGDTRYIFRSEPYRVLYNTFRFPEKWKLYPAPSSELQCNRCISWGNVYKNFIAETYGYNPNSIIVTGHPPLDKASQFKDNPPSEMDIELFKKENGIITDLPIALYIEGAFAYSGYHGWNNESLFEHLCEINDLCAKAGRYLVIKLHPSTKGISELKKKLSGQVEIVQKLDSEMLIWISESIIGHSSTLINTAIVMEKPVFIPRWGISKNIPSNFDKVAPVTVCNEPEDLVSGLYAPEICKSNLNSVRRNYIHDYLDPLDGKSQERICTSIEELINNSN